jgi:hypothetical protein
VRPGPCAAGAGAACRSAGALAVHPAPFWILGWPLACGAEGRKQSKRIGDYPRLQGAGRGGGDLVLSRLSSGLVGALLSLPLSSSSATNFSRPVAQHPLWAGLRRRRQKAEQADRGLVLSLSFGLALLSLPLSSSSATKISRPCGAAPILGWHAAQKAESRASGSRTTDYPLLQGGAGDDLVLSLSSGSGSTLLSLSLLLPPSQLVVGHQIFSACGAAPVLGWPAAQRRQEAEQAASRLGTAPSSFRGGRMIWFSAAAVSTSCFLLLIA